MAVPSRASSSSFLSTFNTSVDSGSPPSLTYSDLSEEVQEIMDSYNQENDASAVMYKVLGHLEQVVEHFRAKGENDAANDIAKDAISIVNTFNDVIATWDIAKCRMNPRSVPSIPSASSKRTTADNRNGGITWATVAATKIDDNNHLVKFGPDDGMRIQIKEDVIPDFKDLRVVWINNWPKNRSLSDVTQRINHGPLFSMAFADDYNSVCIIFQHSAAARALLNDNDYCLREEGMSLFGASCAVMLGNPYPEDNEIRRMALPGCERRRLTFARQQLFCHGMTEEVFRADICNLIGETNVELIWLFNTGNATVVFTSVPIARLVKDAFGKKAREHGPYKDIQVSFSHDPCERPMNLITQMPSPQNGGRLRSGSNKISAPPSTVSRRNSSVRNSPKVDADGWQTVVKRR